MASSGETVTYAEHERRTNRLAHLLRAEGLQRLDHFAIFMENNSRYLECDGAGERSGLYYTCINSYLTPDELAYIVDNSQSQVLITSIAKLPVARAALAQCPRVKRCLVVDGGDAVRALGDPRYADFVEATERHTRHADCRRVARHADAVFVGHHRADPRASSARCPRTRRRSRCRCSTFSTSCGNARTACGTSRRRRCTTRRRRPTCRSPSATAAPW